MDVCVVYWTEKLTTRVLETRSQIPALPYKLIQGLYGKKKQHSSDLSYAFKSL